MDPIPFTKAQAVGNDFLVVEAHAIERAGILDEELPQLSRRICDRRRGVGADGMEVVYPSEEAHCRIRIFNSDGSEAEISGNGTRCVAAWLIESRRLPETLQLATAAGVKTLRLLEADGLRFDFEMTMGQPRYREEDVGCEIETSQGVRRATVVDVGNPQCVFFVPHFGFDWCALGAEVERLPRFPNRTNVSFVKVVDEHAIDVRFWERGAGETHSSGTGSTGAAVAAILSGNVKSPVAVRTPADPMRLRWDGEVFLEGPAELVARGEYFYRRAG